MSSTQNSEKIGEQKKQQQKRTKNPPVMHVKTKAPKSAKSKRGQAKQRPDEGFQAKVQLQKKRTSPTRMPAREGKENNRE